MEGHTYPQRDARQPRSAAPGILHLGLLPFDRRSFPLLADDLQPNEMDEVVPFAAALGWPELHPAPDWGLRAPLVEATDVVDVSSERN